MDTQHPPYPCSAATPAVARTQHHTQSSLPQLGRLLPALQTGALALSICRLLLHACQQAAMPPSTPPALRQHSPQPSTIPPPQYPPAQQLPAAKDQYAASASPSALAYAGPPSSRLPSSCQRLPSQPRRPPHVAADALRHPATQGAAQHFPPPAINTHMPRHPPAAWAGGAWGRPTLGPHVEQSHHPSSTRPHPHTHTPTCSMGRCRVGSSHPRK